jgi:polysaccharide export outer membrane protein
MSYCCDSDIVRKIGRIILAVAFGLLLAVSGQAADLANNTNGLASGLTNGLPKAAAKPAAQEEVSSSRLLQPNDMLVVSVYQQPDLEAKVTIDDQGKVMLPLLGTLKLGGLTLEQATTLVQKLYDKDYLVDPKVNIQVWQMAALRFTILGEVRSPGSYDFPPNTKLNLLNGIAMGGGYTRLAAPSKVTIQRNMNGELKIFTVDAQAMASDRKNPPFQLQPGDTITVTERVF